MRKVLLLFCLLVVPGTSLSAGATELPLWPKARQTMEKCYDGWNAVVTVKAGLKSEYTPQ